MMHHRAIAVVRQVRFHGISETIRARVRSLSGRALCSVSPARCAGSSFTCAERSTAQAPRLLP